MLTNTQGIFRGESIAPGFYTLRVTLAGFLPTIQQHVRISAHVTTVVRVELESMFASLDQLRRQLEGLTSWEALAPIRQRFESRAWDRSHLNWMSYLDLNLRLLAAVRVGNRRARHRNQLSA